MPSQAQSGAPPMAAVATRRKRSSIGSILSSFKLKSGYVSTPTSTNSSRKNSRTSISSTDDQCSKQLSLNLLEDTITYFSKLENKKVPISLLLTNEHDLYTNNIDPTSKAGKKSFLHFVNTNESSDAIAERLMQWDIQKPIKDSMCGQKTKDGLYSIRITPYFGYKRETLAELNNALDSDQDDDAELERSKCQGIYFSPIVRKAGPNSQLLITRETTKLKEVINDHFKDPKDEYIAPILFRTRIISRIHACLKVDSLGNWYIKDFNSKSGTFLNHKRLCIDQESADVELNDGDVIQLGIDHKNGINELFRCVRFKVELNLSWKLKTKPLEGIINTISLENSQDKELCSICLEKMSPYQGVFVSPCCHLWHYNCIRRVITQHYPQFVCPNCRYTSDLESPIGLPDELDEF
ncbi:hypothetical protein KAFR_0B04600 [Kazachstania africana CBS 2517]|uniref:RING-type E3 ubiquitin transferase n=1 Tax=Kazachstania africana (strain ATCC 22294 / BCRC 22015 / CBS 2517 / CECT 1963 / NBRC 1671 / NRRL Y-8276) TaxID=1071382 RepID=H2AQV7_KAZAF|nr:hypothetical protein KAFR_0B04600 [Kazachstania africana CBS 2517]CCF56757.1 hypothetical protein KAFR_0B04600 [Kazachstania africana CBS 2517]